MTDICKNLIAFLCVHRKKPAPQSAKLPHVQDNQQTHIYCKLYLQEWKTKSKIYETYIVPVFPCFYAYIQLFVIFVYKYRA